ncbi:hypothetical protein EYF80_049805 [Liparis tanakae]|uniref:Uncharacterized protein n=1 Tax=Liparis tanakae TaxID=230148 RepID=A0A4Z2FFU1_9TELE|nr:hypothetical protein EYF80_049805 [Liparis tanakae]
MEPTAPRAMRPREAHLLLGRGYDTGWKDGTSNTEPPVKRARVVGGDVIRDEEDMRNVFPRMHN